MLKPKRARAGLEMRTFQGTDGKSTYLVYRTPDGAYHAFREVEAKEAARACGTPVTDGNTRRMWRALWNTQNAVEDDEEGDG